MQRRVGLAYDGRFLEHITPSGHPERADRLRAVTAMLVKTGLSERLHHLSVAEAGEEYILAVHTRDHLQHVRRVSASGGGLLDEGDTHAVPVTFHVALLAAGAVLRAIDAVVRKEVDAAFCAVRPPGHHAERDRPMGFCVFNNVAVGARYAQHRHGVEKVAILDWDVHHGNGTQHLFEEDPSVLFISLHQYPFYPGTGARSERGRGKGEGYTLNIPLPAGTGEQTYLRAFEDEILPALDRFNPDLLMISAGFDAHKDDPLGGMRLEEGSYAKFTRLVAGRGPIVSVLEGGYNLQALAGSVQRHLEMLRDA